MTLTDLKPSDCPSELRHKVLKIVENSEMNWGDVLTKLARVVVSPERREHFFSLDGGFTKQVEFLENEKEIEENEQ